MNKSTIAMKIVSVATAAAVVFGTCFIPEITKADNPSGDSSSEEEIVKDLKVFSCPYYNHTHSDECYENGRRTCGIPDIVVHTHDDKCYDDNNKPICELDEISLHDHADDEVINQDAGSSGITDAGTTTVQKSAARSRARVNSTGSTEENTANINNPDTTKPSEGDNTSTTEEIIGNEEQDKNKQDTTYDNSDEEKNTTYTNGGEGTSTQDTGSTTSQDIDSNNTEDNTLTKQPDTNSIPSGTSNTDSESSNSTTQSNDNTTENASSNGTITGNPTSQTDEQPNGQVRIDSTGIYLYGTAGEPDTNDQGIENVQTVGDDQTRGDDQNGGDGQNAGGDDQTTGGEAQTGGDEVESTDENVQTAQNNQSSENTTCNKQEIKLHTHDDSCYTGSDITCGQPEVIEHQHTDACFEYIESDSAMKKRLKAKMDKELEEIIEAEYMERSNYIGKLYDALDFESYRNELAASYNVKPTILVECINEMFGTMSTIQGKIQGNIEELSCKSDLSEYNSYLLKLNEALKNDIALNSLADALDVSDDDILILKLAIKLITESMPAPVNDTSADLDAVYTYDNYIAFSINNSKSITTDVSWSKLENVDNNAIIALCPSAQSTSALMNKILYCASCYESPTWIKTAKSYVSTNDEVMALLKKAVQCAIWSYTDNYTIPSDNIGSLASAIKSEADSNSGYTNNNWYWCKTEYSYAPNLIVSEKLETGKEIYVGVRYNDGGRIKEYYKYGSNYTNYAVARLNVIKQVDYECNTYDDRTASSIPAYCFNKGLNQPNNTFDGNYNRNSSNSTIRVRYTKSSNVTGDEFAKYADHERLEGKELREWVISIGLNGYPYDYSGFNTDAEGKSILDTEQFVYVTQMAIWYYTDSYDKEMDKAYNRLARFTKEEQEVYDKLISTKLPSSVTSPVSSKVHIYSPIDESVVYGETKYQNLLTVELTETEIPSEPDDTISLTLNKKVEGVALTDTFHFTITITDRDGNEYDGNYGLETDAENTSSLVSGVLSVDLKNGQYIKISGLPYGFGYKIAEDEAEYFTTTIKSDAAPENTNEEERTVSKPFVTEDSEVTFTNTSSYIPVQTGVRVDVLPFIIIMILSAGALGFFMVSCRLQKRR